MILLMQKIALGILAGFVMGTLVLIICKQSFPYYLIDTDEWTQCQRGAFFSTIALGLGKWLFWQVHGEKRLIEEILAIEAFVVIAALITAGFLGPIIVYGFLELATIWAPISLVDSIFEIFGGTITGALCAGFLVALLPINREKVH